MVFECVIYSQLYWHISPYIPPTQFGFIKGTGAQDCSTALSFTAIQALEHQKECQIVSLDIRGTFNSVWWNGLLQYLWSEGWGVRLTVYCVHITELCLLLHMVTPHPSNHSKQAFLRVAFVLHKLDSMQKMAERLCGTTFLSLASCRKVSSIGLLCTVGFSVRDLFRIFIPSLFLLWMPTSSTMLWMTICCCNS